MSVGAIRRRQASAAGSKASSAALIEISQDLESRLSAPPWIDVDNETRRKIMTTATIAPTEQEMKEALASLWWLPLIRGILLGIVGVLMFT